MVKFKNILFFFIVNLILMIDLGKERLFIKKIREI